MDLTIRLKSNTRLDKYPAKRHAQNAARKLGLSTGLLYLRGQETVYFEDSDETIKFRQRRYFYYLTGVSDIPDCEVTYSVDDDLLSLWLLKPDAREVLYSGEPKSPDECKEEYDIDHVEYTNGLPTYLSNMSKRFPSTPLNIYVIHSQLPPIPPGSHIFIDQSSLLPVLQHCRLIKDEHEIALIRRANKISAHGHTAVMSQVSHAKNERDLEALFLQQSIAYGSKSQAYEVIAGSGPNCAVLHYVNNDLPLKGKQLVLLDAGAEYNCYASDITRTFPISGNFTKEAREIYDLVLEMQTECIARIQPGLFYTDLYKLANVLLVTGLKKLGLLKGESVAEMLDAGVSRAFFMHGLGHHIGLDTHDNLPYTIPTARCRTTQPRSRQVKGSTGVPVLEMFCDAFETRSLQAGMVVTVEPGIYFRLPYLYDFAKSNPKAFAFIDQDVLKKYLDVGGVRIEDDILVTENGYENLTTVPKDADVIERLICEGKDAESQ